jgi:hypothetical protein
MTTVTSPPSPLPPRPTPWEDWGGNQRNYQSAYETILSAERHADERIKANPSDKEVRDQLISARVVGCLLVELYARRSILYDKPAASLMREILSESQEGESSHDVVFGVGRRHRDHLLRACAFVLFLTSFCISISLQSVRPPRSTLHLLYTLRVPPSKPWKI